MTSFPDVRAADHHILAAGRPAFTYFAGGEVAVGAEGEAPPEGARQVLYAGSERLRGPAGERGRSGFQPGPCA